MSVPLLLNYLLRSDNPSHKKRIHLSSFDIVESSVPKHWPMSSIMAPPPPPPEPSAVTNPNDPPPGSVQDSRENSSTLADGNVNPTSPKSNVSVDNDAMQVDANSSTFAPPPNHLPTRRTRQNTKRNYEEVEGEKSSEDKKANLLPQKSKKAKQRKSQAIVPSSPPTHDLRLDFYKCPPVPIIIGSQYMKYEVIDLTEIEVIHPKSFFPIRILTCI